MGAAANKLEKANEKAAVEDVQWNQGQPETVNACELWGLQGELWS